MCCTSCRTARPRPSSSTPARCATGSRRSSMTRTCGSTFCRSEELGSGRRGCEGMGFRRERQVHSPTTHSMRPPSPDPDSWLLEANSHRDRHPTKERRAVETRLDEHLAAERHEIESETHVRVDCGVAERADLVARSEVLDPQLARAMVHTYAGDGVRPVVRPRRR